MIRNNRKLQRQMIRSILIWVVFAMVSSLATMITIVNNRKEDARTKTVRQTNVIHYSMDTMLLHLDTLSALVVNGKGEIDHFEDICKDMMKNCPAQDAIKNFQLAPNGVITTIYPEEGNEAGKIDLFADPDRKTEAEWARDTGNLTLAGPYELLQGGFAAVARKPVYLRDADGNTNFWGFVVEIIDIDAMLEPTGIADFEKEGYKYCLWRSDPKTGEKSVIRESNQKGKQRKFQNPISLDIDMPNVVWHFEVEPQKGWVTPANIAYIALYILLAGILGAGIAYHRALYEQHQLQKKTDSLLHESLDNIANSVAVCQIREGSLKPALANHQFLKFMNMSKEEYEKMDMKSFLYASGWTDIEDSLNRDELITNRFEKMIEKPTTKEQIWVVITCRSAVSDEGNRMLYITITDIDQEKKLKIAQKKALFESQHDSLTGVYNRKGFDYWVASDEVKGKQIGFAIVDVDNFKMVNDTYGHEKGDIILKEVARLLSENFRDGDLVFRMGGDEFAILLKNTDISAWNKLCMHQQDIHTSLGKMFDEMYITLSIGMCFSKTGYDERVITLADETLYEVKRNGRAGCMAVNIEGGEKKHWKDESLSLRTKNVLAYNNTGLYRLEYDPSRHSIPRLICGEATRAMFDFENDLTPEECFNKWMKGVDPDYIDTLRTSHELIKKGAQVECTYLWNHPRCGKIYIRTGGIAEKKDGWEILHGYHHSLKDTEIVTRKDDSELMVDSMSSIYFCSYYVDIGKDCFCTLKIAPGERYLQMQDHKATETLHNFISVLVHPNDRDRMTEFMNLKTLPKRFENEVHLDIEYMSLSDKGWCRASFFPVKRDEKGIITNVLFVVTSLDANRAKEAQEGENNRRSLNALYDSVPGGIVMYEWNGKEFRTLHISKYYDEIYGDNLNNNGKPDFKRIHPMDIDAYQQAVTEALTKTHTLEHVFRAYNKIEKQYKWTKINAIAKPLSDGNLLVYAIYTDVSEQMETEEKLRKSQVSLSAALSASNLLSYEYDPVSHTGICYTKENYFNLPQKIENYPDSLKEIDLFHPLDADLFIQTAHSMDHGEKKARCEVRFKKDGYYRWYACIFDASFDAEKNQNRIILTVVDIHENKTMLREYERRLKAIIGANEKSMSIGSVNITNDTYKSVQLSEEMQPWVDESFPLQAILHNASQYIVGEKDQEKFRKTFSQENLLKCANEGTMHVEMEHLFRFGDYHTEWLLSVFDLAKNPVSGEVTGICFSKSVQNERLAALQLQKTNQKDYPMSAIVIVQTGEYFLFDAKKGVYDTCKNGFWEVLEPALKPVTSELSSKDIEKFFGREKVLEMLRQKEEYEFVFDSLFTGQKRRLEIRFSYLDDGKNMILCLIRDITDQSILKKLRHNSEHDPVTDLYNRGRVFQKCRELLLEHPQDQFVMAHVDMRHFHLYNTFFGEKAGDRLLCDMANLLRRLDKEHEHWAYGRIEADVFCVFFPYDKLNYEKYVEKLFMFLKNYRSDFLIEPVFGLYFVTDATIPIETMFSKASIAAKNVKEDTVLGTAIYDEKLERKVSEKQQIVNDMKGAVANEEFEVYLQPKYALGSGEIIGSEALVRWNHPQKGLISPGVFIPIFESNGFIVELDRYMWEHVCMIIKRWMDEGRTIYPISVNVSRVSMYSQQTVSFLQNLVLKYEIDPKYLELELTETAYMDDPNEIKQQLLKLQEFGFHILMDDFGSGYSSLNTLRELPVDVLKLDMKFLAESSKDQRGNIVLATMVQMSKKLGLPVIAEGVETQEQATYLQSIGCEYAQGFLFARPMPVEEYEKKL